MIKAHGLVSIEILEAESPIGGADSTKEVDIESAKDCCLLSKITKLATVVLNQLDPVPAMSLIGTHT